MMSLVRQRRRLRERLARDIPRRRRRAAIDRQLIVAEPALPGGPAVEEAPLGRLPRRRPPRCRAGASCAATGSSAARLAASNPISSASRISTNRIVPPPTPSFTIATSIDGHQDDPAEQRQPEPMPGKPHHAENGGPEMEAVANEGEPVGRREDRRRSSRGHELCRPASLLSAAEQASAAELTLGGWHFARGAWIDRDRRAQRPCQTLEAGFGDMMAVLAI